jgi:hypothetical protein
MKGEQGIAEFESLYSLESLANFNIRGESGYLTFGGSIYSGTS